MIACYLNEGKADSVEIYNLTPEKDCQFGKAGLPHYQPTHSVH